MNAISLLPPAVDPTGSQAATAPNAADLARRGQIAKTAQSFEASFLTTMFETMFASVPTDSAFGGGPGEDMWKSFLAEAMAKQTAKRGGIGVSRAVEREMLKLQEMTQGAAQTSAQPSAQKGSEKSVLASAQGSIA